MEILNLRKLEKNIAVLWDGKDETLYYLNNDFISFLKFSDTKIEPPVPEPYTIIKFEKQTNGDLLLTSQVYYDTSEIRLRTFKLGDYVVLKHAGSIYDMTEFYKMTKDEIILEYEIISSDIFKKDKKKLEAELEIALKNEDYALAAQLRDMIND
jgi:hypothetical protein